MMRLLPGILRVTHYGSLSKISQVPRISGKQLFFLLTIFYLFQIIDLSVGVSMLGPLLVMDLFCMLLQWQFQLVNLFSDLRIDICCNRLVLEEGPLSPLLERK